ncbi:hypothetical protein D3C80_1515460 [compost metagenome]
MTRSTEPQSASSGRSAFEKCEVMTSTYLALTKGSATTDDTHRQIILTALFRNPRTA